MIKQAAALLFVGYIVFLFYIDRSRPKGVSADIWIPFIWMFLAGSHYVSGWIHPGSHITSSASTEGSPVDRAVFLALITLGFIIIAHRRIVWSKFFRRNFLVFLYFVFAATSILWSRYPSTSVKRFIKAIGNIVMVITILSEDDPLAAVAFILRRLAYIVIPLSVLFIKYYPEWGRSYHMGVALFHGATPQKNSLGQLCMFVGIFFAWSLLSGDQKLMRIGTKRYQSTLVYFTLLPMIAWNLYKSSSATSLMTLVIGIAILIWTRLASMKERPAKIVHQTLLFVVVFFTLEFLFGVSGFVINALGRDSSLTTRVPMWHHLLSIPNNFFLGSGYESFWVGDRLEFLWSHWGKLLNAHNGYIETFLNLGLVGLTLLIGYIVVGFANIRRKLTIRYPYGVLCFTFTIVILIYNWTEATFHSVNNLWVILLFSIMDVETADPETAINQTTKKTRVIYEAT